MGKFIRGITTGAIIGAVAGVMIYPGMDRTTRKRIERSGKMVKNAAGEILDNMRGWTK